ncbi:MAG: GTP 3',8-cyclase MoaA [Oceanospirillales bacterium]|uniref:GTP 3',8-cyclase n=1 Tax=Marinobacterium halophilum TaxID=267374 RepID=A0A2P8ERI9_9GAMM|nr:GTP 3',8-cyclase MoaA [Marinobacterium halophilum]MBR9828979.1 GTP 3',8-cyclase MoaA [Oceanospirillales bacterium]PSL12063.1 cyclic pyranopterin monophosphate synthase subunit MoaA [Marinobacterium halophilum]
MPSQLIDRFGRRVNYLRLSVTDRCDFRCVYCMTEKMQFLPHSEVLSLEELYEVAAAFSQLGTNRIRLTGGEPLVRRNIMSLIERLGRLPAELSLTTNGSQLQKMAQDLAVSGVDRLNISLDSLQHERFKDLTRTGRLHQVLDGIEAARSAGFKRIKLNTVVLKGRNDDEVLDLIEFARRSELDISFIEEMPLGQITEHGRAESYCSSDELRELIGTHFDLHPSTERTGGPSRYYRLPGSDIRIGFISPHSHNFCGDCNRVRVTVEGQLLLCLGNEHSVDLRDVLRNHPGDRARLQQTIIDSMAIKPEKHEFSFEDEPQILRFMNMTGG